MKLIPGKTFASFVNLLACYFVPGDRNTSHITQSSSGNNFETYYKIAFMLLICYVRYVWTAFFRDGKSKERSTHATYCSYNTTDNTDCFHLHLSTLRVLNLDNSIISHCGESLSEAMA